VGKFLVIRRYINTEDVDIIQYLKNRE